MNNKVIGVTAAVFFFFVVVVVRSPPTKGDPRANNLPDGLND